MKTWIRPMVVEECYVSNESIADSVTACYKIACEVGKQDHSFGCLFLLIRSIKRFKERTSAAELNKEHDLKKWAELEVNIKTAFLKEYFNEEEEFIGTETQTAYALLLYYELYYVSGLEKLKEGLNYDNKY